MLRVLPKTRQNLMMKCNNRTRLSSNKDTETMDVVEDDVEDNGEDGVDDIEDNYEGQTECEREVYIANSVPICGWTALNSVRYHNY